MAAIPAELAPGDEVIMPSFTFVSTANAVALRGATPVSANSPYGLMREDPAYVLLLGVGLESCTAIHLPEETIAPDIYLRPAEQTEIYECRDRDG